MSMEPTIQPFNFATNLSSVVTRVDNLETVEARAEWLQLQILRLDAASSDLNQLSQRLEERSARLSRSVKALQSRLPPQPEVGFQLTSRIIKRSRYCQPLIFTFRLIDRQGNEVLNDPDDEYTLKADYEVFKTVTKRWKRKEGTNLLKGQMRVNPNSAGEICYRNVAITKKRCYAASTRIILTLICATNRSIRPLELNPIVIIDNWKENKESD